MDSNHHEWWQSGVIYQIYPRSFVDTNHDGIGDLPGIIRKLDYLQWLGVDAIWLSPIYPSPMKDFGYDISDYTDVNPLFGSLKDFATLVDEVHRRGMRLILDFVPNHTSDQHAWFQEARNSRKNPKRNWYLWRDPGPDGGPPNNWLSNFGGSAWQLDETTGQYYYHAFLKEQPDLNWRNPEVRHAMFDVLRFWLDRGVDGFRVDVIWHIVKDDVFRDNPRNPAYQPGQNPHHELLSTYTADRPEVHGIIGEMRRVLDAYPRRMMVGEVYLPIERLITYYGVGGAGVHMPFNFQLITMPWQAHVIRDAVKTYESALPSYGWPNWVLGNHDNPRIASRIGQAQARVAAMLLLTLRGTPTLYYGDEIGMRDVPIPPDKVQDPFEKNVPGMGLGRDPARTPMQWDGSSFAGFSDAEPWLPIAKDSANINVTLQREQRDSMLQLYHRLIQLRRAEPALSIGSYDPIEADCELILFKRRQGPKAFLIALNLGDRPQICKPAGLNGGTIRMATGLNREGEAIKQSIQLNANEGIVIELASGAI
jgi:alpha-glucosidase